MGKRMAFLVGINDYGKGSGLARLNYAETDAKLMADTLEKISGFSTKILLGERATQGEIIRELRTFYNEDNLDLFLFYFAGHGELIRGLGMDCLHCYGSERGDTLGTLKIQEWADRIERKIWARQIVMVVDACRNKTYRGAQTRGGAGLSPSVPSALKEISDHTRGNSSTSDYIGKRFFYTLLSCGVDQFSYEDEELKHGLFTYALAKEIKENGIKLPLNQLSKKVGEYTFKKCKKNGWYPHQIPEWVEPSIPVEVYLVDTSNVNLSNEHQKSDDIFSLSRKQLDALRTIHEKLTCNLSALLSFYLTNQVGVKLHSVEESTYSDFCFSLPNTIYVSAISVEPLSGISILAIDSKMLLPVIDIIDKDSDDYNEEKKTVNDLDRRLIDGLVKTVLEGFEEGWGEISPFNMSVIQSETSPQSITILSSSEKVVSISFELTVRATKGFMHFCIPNALLQKISNDLDKI